MKILYSAEDLWPYVGGAEVGLDEMLAELSKKHEVHAVWVGKEKKKDTPYHQHPQPYSTVWKNVPLFNRTLARHFYANSRWTKVLQRYIDRYKPELMLTQLQFMPASILAAMQNGMKSVSFIQNWEHFCPYLFMNHDPEECLKDCYKHVPLSYKMQWPYVKKIQRMHARAFKNTDVVFGDSQYCCDVLKMFYGVKGYPFHPVVHLDKFKIEQNTKEYVTFINPILTKGITTVLELVRKMPDTKFLVVGGGNVTAKPWIEKVRKEPNVKYIPWEDDIRKVYSKTRLLIVPSTWPEPCGRIVLEAGINGIPTIASARGGLPEAVGKGGILVKDHLNADLWKKAIERFDDDYYRQRSKLAIENAKEHDFDHQFSYFKKTLAEKGINL
ncbi:MAG: glycosyltransferase family 4 protein [Nanoarchaeota archaeon]|nr:glycosyltransferase family 4 protein [Nanoarchaeota archaeon]